MFAEMPLDNRTVNKFAALPLPLGFRLAFLGPFQHRHDRYDLIFRHGWLFRNIEPKICQYG
jgi:hypothetical protein